MGGQPLSVELPRALSSITDCEESFCVARKQIDLKIDVVSDI